MCSRLRQQVRDFGDIRACPAQLGAMYQVEATAFGEGLCVGGGTGGTGGTGGGGRGRKETVRNFDSAYLDIIAWVARLSRSKPPPAPAPEPSAGPDIFLPLLAREDSGQAGEGVQRERASNQRPGRFGAMGYDAWCECDRAMRVDWALRCCGKVFGEEGTRCRQVRFFLNSRELPMAPS